MITIGPKLENATLFPDIIEKMSESKSHNYIHSGDMLSICFDFVAIIGTNKNATIYDNVLVDWIKAICVHLYACVQCVRMFITVYNDNGRKKCFSYRSSLEQQHNKVILVSIRYAN